MKEYEITQEQLDGILDACKSVPYMIIGGVEPLSPQENANRAWEKLGKEMGFDYMTIEPNRPKGNRFFSAQPLEKRNTKT